MFPLYAVHLLPEVWVQVTHARGQTHAHPDFNHRLGPHGWSYTCVHDLTLTPGRREGDERGRGKVQWEDRECRI